MKLTLGFSPCPNDTFIFDALVNKKIDGEGLEFEAVLEDVDTREEWDRDVDGQRVRLRDERGVVGAVRAVEAALACGAGHGVRRARVRLPAAAAVRRGRVDVRRRQRDVARAAGREARDEGNARQDSSGCH